jgi:hypothetical protein
VQQQTLDAPRLRYSLLARALFKTMDHGYGRNGAIVKFIMLEYIARVPYQAWERVGYLALARHRGVPRWRSESPTGSSRPGLSRTTAIRIFAYLRVAPCFSTLTAASAMAK